MSKRMYKSISALPSLIGSELHLVCVLPTNRVGAGACVCVCVRARARAANQLHARVRVCACVLPTNKAQSIIDSYKDINSCYEPPVIIFIRFWVNP